MVSPWRERLWTVCRGVFLLILQCEIGVCDWTSLLDHGKVLGFPSYKQANTLLDSFVAKYPQIFTKHEIGKSFQGLAIYAYCLTAGVDRLYDERNQVLLTALMHAREPASLTVLVYFLGHIMELYAAGEAKAVWIVQTKELWAVPFVNPDGYIANENIPGPGFRKAIRKNLRPTCGQSAKSGVDLNRNFGFHWARQFPSCDEEFQGSKPFSEPETQALKKLIEEHKFEAAVNFHSFGGMLTHPFNWGKQDLPPDDQKVYDEIANVFGWKKFGPAIKTVGYTAPGESDDWMYARHHIFSMSPEVGPEAGDFWPAAPRIKGIDERNFDRTSYVVSKAGLEMEVTWTHVPGMTGVPSKVNSYLKERGGEPVSILELQLRNKGIGPSVGEALHFAVTGTTRNNADFHTDGVYLLQGDGEQALQKPAQLFFPPDAGNGINAPTVGFQISPVASRSVETLRILNAATVDSVEERNDIKLCAVEIPKAALRLPPGAPVVCHCVASKESLPPATGLHGRKAIGPFKAELVKYRGEKAKTAMQKLCNVAISMGAEMQRESELTVTAAPKSKAWACTTAIGSGCKTCVAQELRTSGIDCASCNDGYQLTGRTCKATVAQSLIPATITPGPLLVTPSQTPLESGWTPSSIGLVVVLMATCLLGTAFLRRRSRRKKGDEESVPAMTIGPVD